MADTLSQQQVEHVAKLSRLKLRTADVERYARQISSILDYVAQLQEVNVEGLVPMAHPLPLYSVMREDVVKPSLSVEQVLANAPGKEGPFFTVPKVLDTGISSG
ncbi:MAG TPA: Asp-tRNA(Asn)/Glu-tRNA(Gln) amidotransferase subunit GatC [Phycisphaerae bacterium]|nr:Asp-tRNA(Asn)/Glu-tRNA(Gln) amidotransferase subunit GatC [Phycisphaerae bacterium]